MSVDLLGESLYVQGDVAGARLGFVRRLAGDERVPGRAELVRFLEAAPRA